MIRGGTAFLPHIMVTGALCWDMETHKMKSPSKFTRPVLTTFLGHKSTGLVMMECSTRICH